MNAATDEKTLSCILNDRQDLSLKTWVKSMFYIKQMMTKDQILIPTHPFCTKPHWRGDVQLFSVRPEHFAICASSIMFWLRTRIPALIAAFSAHTLAPLRASFQFWWIPKVMKDLGLHHHTNDPLSVINASSGRLIIPGTVIRRQRKGPLSQIYSWLECQKDVRSLLPHNRGPSRCWGMVTAVRPRRR